MLTVPDHHVDETAIAVVDELNRFIRWTSRAEIHQKRLPHRSVQVLIFTPQHQLVIQKRHPQKQTYANHWDLSSSGHIERMDYQSGDLARLDQEWKSHTETPQIIPCFSDESQNQHNQVYQRVALKEVYEEIGVQLDEIEFLEKYTPLAHIHYEHFHLFKGCSAGPFKAQDTEVAEIRTLSRKEWLPFIQTHPCTRSLIMIGNQAIAKGWWPS